VIVSGQRSPQILVRGAEQSVSLTVYGSASPTVSSGSYSLYTPEGVAIIAGSAVGVAGATASITIDSGELTAYDYGSGYREAWTLTLSTGETLTFERPAILGRRAVTSTVQPGDLSAVNRSLPGVCAFSETDTSGETQQVTWLSYAWEKLDLAWGDVLRDLTQSGRLPTRVVGLDLHAYHRALTLQYIYADLRAQGSDLYDLLHKETSGRVLALAAGARLDYDLNDDGITDLTMIGIGQTEDRANTAAGWPWGLV